MEKTLLRVKELVRKEHNYVITQQVFMYTECSKVNIHRKYEGIQSEKAKLLQPCCAGAQKLSRSLYIKLYRA